MRLPSIRDYLPDHAEVLLKTASAEEEPSTMGRTLKTIGTGLLGFGAGAVGGATAGVLADKVYEAASGNKIPSGALRVAAPVLGATSGLAYSIYKAREMEELRRAREDQNHASQRRVPGQ